MQRILRLLHIRMLRDTRIVVDENDDVANLGSHGYDVGKGI